MSTNKHFIWVNITGGVIGFSPEEIVAFEVGYRQISRWVEYWDYFNFVFAHDLFEGQEATGFSALWHDDEAWRELERLHRSR